MVIARVDFDDQGIENQRTQRKPFESGCNQLQLSPHTIARVRGKLNTILTSQGITHRVISDSHLTS